MSSAAASGRFLTLEGVDGAGKSTHVAFISEWLEQKGHRVVITREPGGSPLAERIRELALHESMDALTETLLMFAARADHLRTLIRPSLDEGRWVVCDRFTDSTIAYQGAGKGVARELIELLAVAVHAATKPDLTLIFDCGWETARQRMKAANRVLDRFEGETRAHFDRVREAYRTLAMENSSRVRVIDSERSLDEVRRSIVAQLETVGA